MKVAPEVLAVVTALEARGLPMVEVYAKEGRSRRIAWEDGHRSIHTLTEAGWAVRAGDRHCSLFAARAGRPDAGVELPEPDGYPLRLPPPVPIPGWREPADLDAPLVGEREGETLLETIAELLAAEVPGARLDAAVLEDGSSRASIASSRGVRAHHRRRVAALRLEASWEGVAATLYRAEREARRLAAPALARALADRLIVRARGAAPDRDEGEVVVAPNVAAQILRLFGALWIGVDPRRLGGRELVAGTEVASPLVTLVDDGRLAGGILASPVDGEGLPTGAVTIVDAGSWRGPVLPWWASAAGTRPSGCARRPGWRDLPVPGFSHLYLRPDPAVAPGRLLAALASGVYLVDVDGPGHVDLEADRFTLPVCGFQVRGGRAVAPLARAWLAGTVSGCLAGVRAVARDLAFVPAAGMIGSPTLLVAGLEIRGAP